MEFVNLTPHEITIFEPNQLRDGVSPSVTFLPSGNIARVAMEEKTIGSATVMGRFAVPIAQTELGEVFGLPEPQYGVAYLVSGVVFDAVPERNDLFVPHDLVRDEEGRVIGCRALRSR